MNYGLYLSAGGMMTNMYRQGVASNNLANLNTNGFKRDIAEFSARRPEALEDPTDPKLSNALLERLGGGTYARMGPSDHSNGAIQETGNALDFAIQGEGFFVVQQGEGADAKLNLTRDGRMTLNDQGQLVTTTSGHLVMDVANQPITLDPTLPIEVTETGQIYQGGAIVAELRFANPAHPSRLKHLGQGMYEIDPTTLTNAPPSDGQILQGYTEASNVDPIKELLTLIDSTRSITNHATMMKYHDNIMDRAVNVLGRVG